jgi:ABC-type glycerol-3-phosphate transport system substrate-binding protein
LDVVLSLHSWSAPAVVVPYVEFPTGVDPGERVAIDPYSIQTWDQLVDTMGKVARAKRNKPFGLPLGNARNAGEKTEWFFRGNGLQNLADFDPAKRANYIEVLETLKRLRPFIPDDALAQDYTGHRQAFATGVAGFISIGDYYFGEIYPTAKKLMTREQVVIVPYPSGSRGPGKPVVSENSAGPEPVTGSGMRHGTIGP